jgi:hypothetical protein
MLLAPSPVRNRGRQPVQKVAADAGRRQPVVELSKSIRAATDAAVRINFASYIFPFSLAQSSSFRSDHQRKRLYSKTSPRQVNGKNGSAVIWFWGRVALNAQCMNLRYVWPYLSSDLRASSFIAIGKIYADRLWLQ